MCSTNLLTYLLNSRAIRQTTCKSICYNLIIKAWTTLMCIKSPQNVQNLSVKTGKDDRISWEKALNFFLTETREPFWWVHERHEWMNRSECRKTDMPIHYMKFFNQHKLFCHYMYCCHWSILWCFSSNPNAVVKPAAAAAPPVEEKPQQRQHDSDSDVEFSDDEKQSTSSDSDFTWTQNQLRFMWRQINRGLTGPKPGPPVFSEPKIS